MSLSIRSKVIGAGVALGTAVATATAVIAPGSATACELATVPYVVNDPTPAAADSVQLAGLVPKINGVWYNSYVVGQTPSPGRHVCVGSTVTLRTTVGPTP
jgi:hypothetical protein